VVHIEPSSSTVESDFPPRRKWRFLRGHLRLLLLALGNDRARLLTSRGDPLLLLLLDLLLLLLLSPHLLLVTLLVRQRRRQRSTRSSPLLKPIRRRRVHTVTLLLLLLTPSSSILRRRPAERASHASRQTCRCRRRSRDRRVDRVRQKLERDLTVNE
jgi:hypothetical protein